MLSCTSIYEHRRASIVKVLAPEINVKEERSNSMPAERAKKIQTLPNLPNAGDPERKRVLNVLAQRRYRKLYRGEGRRQYVC
jgi:hypothetical protein